MGGIEGGGGGGGGGVVGVRGGWGWGGGGGGGGVESKVWWEGKLGWTGVGSRRGRRQNDEGGRW